MKFVGTDFDWDAGNKLKCQKHGVSLGEIEALFAKTPLVVADERHSIDEKRLIAIGPNQDGRMVFVGFTLRMRGENQLIRPISARYMRQKEFLRYVKSSA